MTDGSQNTEGNAQPTSAEGSSPTTVAAPANDGVPSGVQARLDTMAAQKNQAVKEAQDMRAELDRLREQTKSDQEKAMDAFAKERLEQFKVAEYDPIATIAEQMKGVLQTQVDEFKSRVPEDKRPASFDTLPLVQQFEAYKALASSLGTGTPTTRPPVNGGGNPPNANEGKRIWKQSELRANNSDAEWWKSHREDILAAQREGRILYNE